MDSSTLNCSKCNAVFENNYVMLYHEGHLLHEHCMAEPEKGHKLILANNLEKMAQSFQEEKLLNLEKQLSEAEAVIYGLQNKSFDKSRQIEVLEHEMEVELCDLHVQIDCLNNVIDDHKYLLDYPYWYNRLLFQQQKEIGALKRQIKNSNNEFAKFSAIKADLTKLRISDQKLKTQTRLKLKLFKSTKTCSQQFLKPPKAYMAGKMAPWAMLSTIADQQRRSFCILNITKDLLCEDLKDSVLFICKAISLEKIITKENIVNVHLHQCDLSMDKMKLTIEFSSIKIVDQFKKNFTSYRSCVNAPQNVKDLWASTYMTNDQYDLLLYGRKNLGSKVIYRNKRPCIIQEFPTKDHIDFYAKHMIYMQIPDSSGYFTVNSDLFGTHPSK